MRATRPLRRGTPPLRSMPGPDSGSGAPPRPAFVLPASVPLASVLPALVLAALVVAALTPRSAAAQQRLFRGYALNVAGYQGASPYGPAGASDFQRLRLMLFPTLGPVRLDVAYEHTLLWQQRGAAAGLALQPGAAPASSNNLLDLSWTVERGGHALWQHRLDRLAVAASLGSAMELTVGRQAVSWATTLFFTPTDPFAPFDPSDPFREYRAGIDAARLQYFAGPFTTLDLVIRPEHTFDGHPLTALLRGRTQLGGWGVSAWAGALHGRAAGAVGAEGAVGGWALRGDAALLERDRAGAVVRAAVGAQRRVSLLDRDLQLLFELQHDGLGAARPSELLQVLASPAYRRGELQVLGRDEALADASWQVHPLVSTEILGLLNLRDGSALLAPAVAVSISDEVSGRAGLYLSPGAAGLGPLGAPRSEYGAIPRYFYLSLTAFF